MHGLKRRVDANSLSLFSQPPFAKPGIVFSTFGKLILKEPVICKRKINRILKRKRGREQERERKHFKKGGKRKALAIKRARASDVFFFSFFPLFFVEHCES